MKALYWNNKILKSGYTILQTKKGLSKAWIGYTIAKKNGELEKLKYYASGIQRLQRTSRCRNYESTIPGKISEYRYR
jgi:hypothetical protein